GGFALLPRAGPRNGGLDVGWQRRAREDERAAGLALRGGAPGGEAARQRDGRERGGLQEFPPIDSWHVRLLPVAPATAGVAYPIAVPERRDCATGRRRGLPGAPRLCAEG